MIKVIAILIDMVLFFFGLGMIFLGLTMLSDFIKIDIEKNTAEILVKTILILCSIGYVILGVFVIF